MSRFLQVFDAFLDPRLLPALDWAAVRDPNTDLDLDAAGNILTHPVTGWITGAAGGIGVILAVQYLLDAQGKTAQVQFALTTQQCLDLAERLTTLAARVSELPPPGMPLN